MERAYRVSPARSHPGVFSAETSTPVLTKFVNALRLDRHLRTLFSTLVTWQTRASQRRHLAELDLRYRVDAGLSDGDVAAEIRKPFWKG